MNTTTMTNDYQLQTKEALSKCGATIKIRLSNTKTPDWYTDHKTNHNHYKVTISTHLNGYKSYTFDFWGSHYDWAKGINPTEYDVIACLEWNCPESFKDFCDEMGYDFDSRKAHKTWKACLAQTKALHRIFPNESQREMLAEIR